MKLERIIEGWGNYIFPDKEVEKLANERAVICAKCRHNKREWCRKCGCFVPAKVRSVSEMCPIDLW